MPAARCLPIIAGVVLGPILLTILQASEYTTYSHLAFSSVGVSLSLPLRQYAGLVTFNGYLIIGGLLGGMSGSLVAAWRCHNIAWVRRVAAANLLLSSVIGLVTVFVFDPESGIWGMGAPELQVWLVRVVFNSALKWCIVLVIAAVLVTRQLERN